MGLFFLIIASLLGFDMLDTYERLAEEILDFSEISLSGMNADFLAAAFLLNSIILSY